MLICIRQDGLSFRQPVLGDNIPNFVRKRHSVHFSGYFDVQESGVDLEPFRISSAASSLEVNEYSMMPEHCAFLWHQSFSLCSIDCKYTFSSATIIMFIKAPGKHGLVSRIIQYGKGFVYCAQADGVTWLTQNVQLIGHLFSVMCISGTIEARRSGSVPESAIGGPGNRK